MEQEYALKISEYKEGLVYEDSSVVGKDQTEKKKRKHNIIWYIILYSGNVKTITGKILFKLLNKRFPRGHKFFKLFNKKTVKLSYRNTKNMASLIASLKIPQAVHS